MVALLLIGIFAGSALAFGPDQKGFQGPGHGPGNHRGIEQVLNLTPEQQQKLLAIRQDCEREILPLRQKMQQKRLEKRQLWAADSLNQNAIENNAKEIAGLKVKMIEKFREMQAEMKKVLTPEQQQKMEELRKEHHRGFGDRRNGGRPGRGGCGRFNGDGPGSQGNE